MKFNEVLEKWCNKKGYNFDIYSDESELIYKIGANFSDFYLTRAGPNFFRFNKSTQNKVVILRVSSGTLADLMRYIERNDYMINLRFGA